MKRKICVVTGARSEYGLLHGLMNEIKSDPNLELQIIATCMHLSPEFGMTHKEIEKDGFVISSKVENLLSSDTPTGISKSMGLTFVGLTDSYNVLKPDIVVILGDRFEAFCAAATACVNKIPIAHIHGGETTQGAMDEAFRHSISKMSHLHFTCTEAYRNRVIQLGESPSCVFNVGALGVENINKMSPLSKDELERSIDFKLGAQSILVTFHPATLEKQKATEQFAGILSAIDRFDDLRIIFTKANADSEGRAVNRLIDRYVEKNRWKAICFASMGQLKYLSALKFVSAMIGNSSSGIIESASFKLPVVNIGDRQKGRVKPGNVIDCMPTPDDIAQKLDLALSKEFSSRIKNIKNPYEKENTALVIKETIKEVELKDILKKKFYDYG